MVTYTRKTRTVFVDFYKILTIVAEIFKIKNNIAHEIMKEVFVPAISSYNISNNNSFQRIRINSF